jgi:mono/diheme cytochrome c family protein
MIRWSLLALAILGPIPAHGQPAPTPDDVKQGEYLARIGDCAACHTAPGGQEFAGGLPMKMPFGTIYSTNITPDPETGIGGYSLPEFDAALRAGIAKDGHHLYPAMPYPSFAKTTDHDIQSLYAYFMHGVGPVKQPNKHNDVPWPLDIRWPLAVWNASFADTEPFKPDSGRDQDLNRGAYLVQALGHCGACHTPRGIGFQEKATDDSAAAFLAGGPPLDGWVAPSLRLGGGDGSDKWPVEDLVDFLATGRTLHWAAFGGMSDVIRHSGQYMTAEDLRAIAKYLRAIPAVATTAGAQLKPDGTALALHAGDVSRPGAAAYVDSCAACHRTDGAGYERVFPKLAGNPAILQDDPTDVINVVLKGSTLPATARMPSQFVMPPFGARLSDQEVADLVTFVRTSWGNQSRPVTPEDVNRLR